MECTQIIAKLRVAARKRSGAHGSPASCFTRKSIGYLDELRSTVDLRGRNRHDIVTIDDQGIAPSRVACLLMPLGMVSTAIVLRRNAGLRPQQIAHHPVAPRDARCLFRKHNRLVGKRRRQAQTAPSHGHQKQGAHFRFLHGGRFRTDELHGDARLSQPFNALGAVDKCSEPIWRCELSPYERTRQILTQGVASAKLVTQGDELAHGKGLGHLNEHELGRAHGNTRADFKESPTRKHRGKLMEANPLRRVASSFGPRKDMEGILSCSIFPQFFEHAPQAALLHTRNYRTNGGLGICRASKRAKALQMRGREMPHIASAQIMKGAQRQGMVTRPCSKKAQGRYMAENHFHALQDNRPCALSIMIDANLSNRHS